MPGHFLRVLVLIMPLLCLQTACDSERYFGPYALQVPTALQQHSDSRTFELPLDSDKVREQDNLSYCQQNEPDREIPCRCDYPVLSVNDQLIRLDYHLENPSQDPVNATVWVGVEVPAQWPSPMQVADLPRVALLASHTHRVKAGQTVDDIMDEDEMSQAQEVYTEMFFAACDPDYREPAPLSFISGLSMDEDDEGKVDMEFTIRVRLN